MVPAVATGRAQGEGHGWMAAIASCPLSRAASHLNAMGYFCQVRNRGKKPKP